MYSGAACWNDLVRNTPYDRFHDTYANEKRIAGKSTVYTGEAFATSPLLLAACMLYFEYCGRALT